MGCGGLGTTGQRRPSVRAGMIGPGVCSCPGCYEAYEVEMERCVRDVFGHMDGQADLGGQCAATVLLVMWRHVRVQTATGRERGG